MRLNKEFDIVFEDDVENIYEQELTLLFSKLFTNARFNGKNGYWVDIDASTFWTDFQSPKSDVNLARTQEKLNAIASDLMLSGDYDELIIDTSYLNDKLLLKIFCKIKDKTVRTNIII